MPAPSAPSAIHRIAVSTTSPELAPIPTPAFIKAPMRTIAPPGRGRTSATMANALVTKALPRWIEARADRAISWRPIAL
jgi:hypothetical protein